MRRIDAARRPVGPLEALRRFSGWKVDLAQAEFVRASASLQYAQDRAAQVAAEAQALAEWARMGGLLQPALQLPLLQCLQERTRQQQQAIAECAQHTQALARTRKGLELVRARQKALERIAERAALRCQATQAARHSHDLDEQWLCSLRRPGSER